MLAELQRAEDGYVARLERHWSHTVEEVWSWLTVNDKLQQWFPELEVDELRVGGILKFNMPDGKVIPMDILELRVHELLAFTWAQDRVRFELRAEKSGECCLVFSEHLHAITAHTPRDLAGWHVCFNVIEALMAGRTITSRKDMWQEWYETYKQLTETYIANQV